VSDYGKQGYSGVKTTFGFWENGYGFLMAENNGTEYKYSEKTNFTTFDNVKLLKPYSGSGFELSVGPGQTEIVLIQQLDATGRGLGMSSQPRFDRVTAGGGRTP